MKSKSNTKLNKRFLEGDVASVNDERTIGQLMNTKVKMTPRLKAILATAIGGTITYKGGMAIYKNLTEEYGIESLDGLIEFFKAAPGNEKAGWWSTISTYVINAINWSSEKYNELVAFLKTPIRSTTTPGSWKTLWRPVTTNSKITYMMAFGMALAASAVALVLYKIVKSLYNKQSVNVKDVRESVSVFKKLNMVTEDFQLPGFYHRNETFIQRMWGKVVEMYKMATKAVSNNKLLTLVIVCTMCVAAWLGIRQYMFNSEDSGLTMESFLASHRV